MMNMKIRDGFVVREVAGQCVVIALGAATKDFNGMIKLNSSGKLIFEKLSVGAELEDIVEAMVSEYDIDADSARRDALNFIEKLQGANILE